MKPPIESKLPIPILRRRMADAYIEKRALESNCSPVLARVLASRTLTHTRALSEQLAPSLNDLDDEYGLVDMEPAAQRLASAIVCNEVIGIATDYDMDGLGAHATFRLALVEMFGHSPRRLRSYIGHRLAEGYGLTRSMADRVVATQPTPTLLITADSGSADEPRIAQLSAAGIEVIVTDHHELPMSGPPASAYACVNPKRIDCGYPDKSIAGGMVAWLLLRATRRILREIGHAPAHNAPLDTLLDFVACSTVADCVSMASPNNRALVRAGLALMNDLRRPCWQAIARSLKISSFRSDSIAFGIAPRINARTRLADPFAALHFLLARDLASASGALAVLEAENQTRKAIERKMIDSAIQRAARQVDEGRCAIALQLPDGHPGVQGICSARLVEVFGRPVFLFSPHAAQPNILTGSARTTDAIDIKALLLKVEQDAPGLIQRCGGHKAAAGAQIREEDFPIFEELFERAARAAAWGESLEPFRWSDGELPAKQATLALLDDLEALEPTGKGFEPATFDGKFEIVAVREMGDGTHLRLRLRQDGEEVSAVWFRARRSALDPLPITVGESVHLVYGLSDSTFNGRRRLEWHIKARVRELPATLAQGTMSPADRYEPVLPTPRSNGAAAAAQ